MRFSEVLVPAAALLASVAVADSSLEARSTCYSGIYAIVARGTSEPQGGSQLKTVVGPLTAAIPDSASNEVVYPADNDFYPSVKQGVENAQQQIQDYASACPNSRMVIFGYSQGALVMSIALAGGSANGTTFQPISQDIGKNIVSVVMFGDPSRVQGQGTAAEGSGACQVNAPLVRTGAAYTAMNFYADRLEDWCKAADPICCKTGNDIQAHLSYWTTNTTDTADQFVESHDTVSSGSASSTATSSVPEGAVVTPSAGAVSSALASASALTSSLASEASSLAASHSTKTSSTSTSASASVSAASATASKGAATTSASTSFTAALFSSCMGIFGLLFAL